MQSSFLFAEDDCSEIIIFTENNLIKIQRKKNIFPKIIDAILDRTFF